MCIGEVELNPIKNGCFGFNALKKLSSRVVFFILSLSAALRSFSLARVCLLISRVV